MSEVSDFPKCHGNREPCRRQPHCQIPSILSLDNSENMVSNLITSCQHQQTMAGASMTSFNLQLTLVALPPEIHHLICLHLDRESRASLRRVCRFFKEIPERRLFAEIIVDARFDSIERLGAIGQHPRLCKLVEHITLDTAQFSSSNQKAWHRFIASYSPSGCSASHHPNFTYHRVFQHQLSLNTEQRAQCHANLLEVEKQQLLLLHVLKYTTVFCMLRGFLTVLPNVRTVEVLGGWASKHVWEASDPTVPDGLRLSQRETLSIPAISNDKVEENDKVLQFAAAVVLAALQARPNLTSLRIRGLSSLILQYIANPHTLGLGDALPESIGLKIIYCYVGSVISNQDDIDTTGVNKLIKAAKGLEVFQYRGEIPCTMLGQLTPLILDGAQLPSLRTLDLGGCAVQFKDLLQVFDSVRGQLRHVRLGAVRLYGGNWPDTLAAMRVLSALETILFFNHLYADDGVLEILDGTPPRKGIQLPARCLRDRVASYFYGLIDRRPFIPSTAPRAQKQWEEVSDHSLSYCAWVTWIDLPEEAKKTLYDLELAAMDTPSGTVDWNAHLGAKLQRNAHDHLSTSESSHAPTSDEFPLHDPRVDSETIKDLIIEHFAPEWYESDFDDAEE